MMVKIWLEMLLIEMMLRRLFKVGWSIFKKVFKINRQIVELVKAKIGPIKAMAMEVGLLHKTCCLSKVDFVDEFIIGERPIQMYKYLSTY